MKVITTCHAEGFTEYGFRCLESFHLWPANAELTWYTEGFALPESARVTGVSVDKISDLEHFKARHVEFEAPGWRWDVVRFANKVFAAIDALYDHKGLGVWLDADCVTFKRIPEGFIESMLPAGNYLAYFGRRGMYTETGFWIMDCSHPQHMAFLDSWRDWYLSGKFKRLTQWHDCMTFDATRRAFEEAGLIHCHNLSCEFDREHHPLVKSQLGQYIDHCKGPRKAAGVSPESELHKAATA